MTHYQKKKIKNIVVITVLIASGCFLIFDKIRHNNAVTEFLKKECKYNSESKAWNFDIKWYLDENNLESISEPKKTFSGNNGYEECINYGRDLEREIRNLSE